MARSTHEAVVKVEIDREGLDELKDTVKSAEDAVEALKPDRGEEVEEKSMHAVYGATSFQALRSALDAEQKAMEVQEYSRLFPMLVRNILEDDMIDGKEGAIANLAGEFADIVKTTMNKEKGLSVADRVTNFMGDMTKAVTKREGGVDYPASDFAYVPDRNKPSSWKLRLAEGKPGNITKAQLGRASAAFSSGGFRGNKVQVPSGAMSGIKARIRREYSKLGVKPDEIPESIRKESFYVWYSKETSQYRWLAIYSNRYRDNDNPPEIIAEKSHEDFVKGVDLGVYPYPELWLWHVKGSRVGVADWLAYDEGFSLASGYFDEGKEHVAKGLAEYDNLLVSHGMPSRYIRRDQEDRSVIVRHITKEISPLPDVAAANKLTSFKILTKENDMSLPDIKKQFLEEVGLTPDEIEDLEGSVKAKSEEAEGLEYKEDATAPATEEATAPEEEPVTTTADEEEEATAPAPTSEEIVKALAAFAKPIVEKLNALEAEVKELRTSDREKIAKKAAATPRSSLEALAADTVAGLFSKENQVDGRSALAKSGPKEAPDSDAGAAFFFEKWMTPSLEESTN